MAELADAQDLGSCGLKTVEVQILSPAPNFRVPEVRPELAEGPYTAAANLSPPDPVTGGASVTGRYQAPSAPGNSLEIFGFPVSSSSPSQHRTRPLLDARVHGLTSGT